MLCEMLITSVRLVPNALLWFRYSAVEEPSPTELQHIQFQPAVGPQSNGLESDTKRWRIYQ